MAMSEKLSDYGILGFIEVMLEMVFFSPYFIYHGTDYYTVNLVYPYAGTIYDKVPTP